MALDRRNMLNTDHAGLSDSDKLVLLIMERYRPVTRSRIQTTSLLYLGIHKGYVGVGFFRGISDDIDESSNRLHDRGFIESVRDGYILTEYGEQLRGYATEMPEDRAMALDVRNIVRATAGIPDKNLVGLTHHFYPDMGFNPSIGVSVDRFNKDTSYDGVPLDDYSRDTFEKKLRDGAEIHTGR